MTKQLKSITLVVGLAFLTLGKAQSTDQSALDNFLDTLGQHDKFMGTIVVLDKGKEVYAHTVGHTNFDQRAKADAHTLYRIGSISKTLTATLVLKAVEEGRLELSNSVDNYFPTMPNANQITLAQLLDHHSGIHNFTGDPSFAQWRTEKKTEREMVDIISQGGIDFKPGTQGEYSNSNYVLLSYILQKVYSKPYGQILQEQIIAPLQLKETRFGDEHIPDGMKVRSYTYEIQWNPVVDTDLSIPMGAGAILMSAHDLAGFVEALFGGKLLSQPSLDTMLTITDGYGLGVFKTELLGKTAYTHDGKIDGFNAIYYFFPEERITYVMLSNAENYDLPILHRSIIAPYLGLPLALPKLAFYDVSQEELQALEGRYTGTDSPLVITISEQEGKLLAQPEGQRIYTMDAEGPNQFRHDKSGVTLEFDPAQQTMTMIQGGQELHFIRSQ
ncbi:serine hydrolase domain-containing protein [Flagellimonas aurea]|uniref:serine hydrolase domain-containing protein n=1 Tax=Flagellimonas aurea TaxID=2915619 RepID=UPI0035CFD684